MNAKTNKVVSKPSNSFIGEFLTDFCRESTSLNYLVTDTAIAVIRYLADCLMIGYFESKVELKNGKDQGMKKTLTNEMAAIFADVAETRVSELEAIPDHLWSGEPEKAQLEVFQVSFTATTSKFALVAGSQLKKVRAVFQFVCDTQGRMAAWNMVHGDESRTFYLDQLEAWKDHQKAIKVAEVQEQTEESESSESTDPDDSGTSIDLSKIDKTMSDSYTKLGHELAQFAGSKGQAGAIAKLMNDVTAELESIRLPTQSEAKTKATQTKAPTLAVKKVEAKVASK
jgi:hypothetical protein